jgi:YVTN family beta-propeller protein
MKRSLLIALFSALTALQAASLDPNNPTGTHGLVLIDKLGDHVRFFDPATFQEQASGTVNIINVSDPHGKQTVLTVGKDPMGFAISPDGQTALVANHGDGTVSVISLAEDKVVSTFKGGTGIETLSYY